MAKPCPPHNRPDISEGPGEEAAEEGREESAEAKEEGKGGKQGDKAKSPPPPVVGRNNRRATRPERAYRREGRHRKMRGKRQKGTGTERPQGGHR